eukprot:NODE_633_length_5774_cov_0.180617.p1 type:complete len:715 gc:universal NODE_633_length_5774_cov_0.180617:5521-3377(-)
MGYPATNKRKHQEDNFISIKRTGYMLHALTKREENSLSDQINGIQNVYNEIKTYPKQASQSIKMIIIGAKTMLHRAAQLAVLLALLDKDGAFSNEMNELIEKEWEDVMLKNDAQEVSGIVWFYLHLSAVGLISKLDYQEMLNELGDKLTCKNVLQGDFYASLLEFVLPVYYKYNSEFTTDLAKKLQEFYSDRKTKESELFNGNNKVLNPYNVISEVIPVELSTIDARREAFNSSISNNFHSQLVLVHDLIPIEGVVERRVSLTTTRLSDVVVRDFESFSYSGYICRIFDRSCLKMDYFKSCAPRAFRLPDVVDPVYWYFKRFFSDCSGIMHGSLWECSVQTLTIPCAFKDDVFVSVSKMTELIQSTKNDFIHEKQFISCHLITELVGIKLMNPLTNIHWTFTTNLLIRYCTELSAIFPSTVGRLIHSTFYRLKHMTLPTVLKFSNLFALFLSNYEMNWAFQAWCPVLTNKENKNEIIFVQHALLKCAQLLPIDKVRIKVPEDIESFLPTSTKMINKYNDMDEYKAFAKSITTQLQKKTAFTKVDDEEVIDPMVRSKIQYLCILQHGQVSLSHAFVALEKYVKLLATIKGASLIEWTWEAWVNHPSCFYRLLHKLMSLGVVKHSDVIDWICGRLEDGASVENWKIVMILLNIITDDEDLTGDEMMDIDESSYTTNLLTHLIEKPKATQLLGELIVAVLCINVASQENDKCGYIGK